ncbi:MAG: hypothetical protein HC817_00560 [Saprospiraceae bacterium]|nr:hypothetical protein [Saprospiraceae bacterium]
MKEYISSRTTNLIISVCGGLTFWVVLNFLYTVAPEKSAFARILQIMGGTPDGYIQMLTYIAFLLGILEIMQRERFIKTESAGFNLFYYPLTMKQL